jgi:ABC-type amino acid transport system permease subunit
MAYFGDTLSHAALLGVALGFALDVSPALAVTVGCLLLAGSRFELGGWFHLGLLGAAAKLSGSRPLVWLAQLYTTVVRGVPDLKRRMDAVLADFPALADRLCAADQRIQDFLDDYLADTGLQPRLPLLLQREAAAFWLSEHPEFPDQEFAALLQPTEWPALLGEYLPEPEPSPQLCFDFALTRSPASAQRWQPGQ